MTDTQNDLLNILRTFDLICKNNKIEYFLTGGSVLGAVRHNGFIPWDDDIDLGMSRQMWNKLMPILKEELPDGIVLVCNEDYPAYHNPVVRIVNTKSARITRAALGDGCPKGQFLEIFIHDPVPKEKVAQHKALFETYCELNTPYLAMLQQKFRLRNGLKDEELAVADKYFRIMNDCDEAGLQRILADMKSELSKYSKEDSDYYLLGWGPATNYYPIRNYSEMRMERFEDMELPVPVRACSCMRIDYRNEWMNYPEKSSQVAPHMTAGTKGVSGEEYMKLIAEEVSFEETNAMRFAIKELNLEGLKDRVERDKAMFGIRMKLAQDIDRRSKDLSDLYLVGRYGEITDRFRAYINLKKRAYNYSLYEDIRPETKEIIASSLVLEGRLTDAENVMDVERNWEPSPDHSDFVNELLCLAESVPEYYDGFFKESRNLLGRVREEWHRSPVYRKTSARLNLKDGIASKDAYKLFEEYPEDAETAKLAADAMMLDGRRSEAENLYRQVLENGNNGMDILDIKKRLEV